MWRHLSTVLASRRPVPIVAVEVIQTTEPRSTPVPDFVGMPLAEARRVARLKGQQVYVIERATTHGLRGRVLEQAPLPGEAPDADAILMLTVGARPHVIVPDVRGRAEDDALSMLRQAGLGTARRATRRSDAVSEGLVIRTRPRAGAEVPAGSLVSYVVAAGPRSTQRRRRDDRTWARVRHMPDGSFGRSET